MTPPVELHNWSWALAKLKEGKKLRHKAFDDGRYYIWLKDKEVLRVIGDNDHVYEFDIYLDIEGYIDFLSDDWYIKDGISTIGNDFNWVIRMLQQNIPVKRSIWNGYSHIEYKNGYYFKYSHDNKLMDDGSDRDFSFTVLETQATDWEVYHKTIILKEFRPELNDFSWALRQLKEGLCVIQYPVIRNWYFKGYPENNTILVIYPMDKMKENFTEYLHRHGSEDLFTANYILYEIPEG